MIEVLPMLSEDEQMVMRAICARGMFNPQYAAVVYVNPHPIFQEFKLNTEQISQIVAYFRWINERSPQLPKERNKSNLGSKMELSADQAKTPELSSHERQVLMKIIDRILIDPEFGVSFIAQPMPILKEAHLNDDEIKNMEGYFRTVLQLIKRYHEEDWIN